MITEFHAKINTIAEWTGGLIINGDPEREISFITTDSRELGENCLFVPLLGERYDGHQFINELAKEKKIAAFLTMKKEYQHIAEVSGVCAILCVDTLKAYGQLGSNHRMRMKSRIIGVTGTNGKTTTKELIWSILSRKYKTLKNEKNYNNEIGVPYSLLGMRDEHEWAVIEMGMNHKGEIDRLSQIAKPDIALITNVGEGHLEYLGTIENVAYAKAEIMNSMKQGSAIILNSDSQCFDILYKRANEYGLKIKTFGLYNNADIKPAGYKMFRDWLRIEYNNDFFDVPLYGIHNLYNALAAISLAFFLNIENDVIQNAFSGFKNIDMRSQIINREFTIIDDTYNSNPLSAKYALRSLQEIFPDRRKIAILSDMKELGDSSKYYHLDIGKQVYTSGIDILLTWGETAENITAGAIAGGMDKENALYFKTKNELIDFAQKKIDNNDVILVKGSRSMKMEEVVEALVH